MRQKYFFLLVMFVVILLLSRWSLYGQENKEFDVDLLIDYSAAEQTLRLYEDQFINATAVAELRGNRIAASTTGMIAANGASPYVLERYLDSLKSRQFIHNDIYQLEEAKNNVEAIRNLLDEIKKSNFNRKVAATVEQIFPHDVEVSTRIPVYIVALGHENVDAFVRRIAWNGDEPQFVGETEGELTIVINLAHAIKYSDDLKKQYIELLGVVAHEVFHSAFGAYKEESRRWRRYYRNHQGAVDALLDLTHNEGIAYYLSLEQQIYDNLPLDWNSRMREVFIKLNSNVKEMLSPNTSYSRKTELIRAANLSGFWESYGSMAGMYIARTIDKQLGRAALIETISLGPFDFFNKYIELTRNDASLPKLDNEIKQQLSK